MTKLLIKLFVKDKDNVTDPAVRGRYAALAGITGILLNLLLFAGKLTAGLLAASVAVIADAFNNVSDAARPSSRSSASVWLPSPWIRNTRWDTAGWNISRVLLSIC